MKSPSVYYFSEYAFERGKRFGKFYMRFCYHELKTDIVYTLQI